MPNLHNAHGAQATWHVHLGLDYGAHLPFRAFSGAPPHCHTLTALSTCVGRPRSWRWAPPLGSTEVLWGPGSSPGVPRLRNPSLALLDFEAPWTPARCAPRPLE